MGNCCENLAMYFLVRFNFIFAITGLALIAFGAYVEIQASHYLSFLGDEYDNTPTFIIIIGVVILLVGFLGCCCTCKDNQSCESCVMYIYAIILAIILIAEIGAGIAAYVFKGDLEVEVARNMKESMGKYNVTGHQDVTQSWDRIEGEFKCCGVINRTDWLNSTYGLLPDSCCVPRPGSAVIAGCGQLDDNVQEKYGRGCLELLKEQFMSNMSLIGGLAIGIALLHLGGVILACYVGNKIRNS